MLKRLMDRAKLRQFVVIAVLLLTVIAGRSDVFLAQGQSSGSRGKSSAHVPGRILLKFRSGTEPKRKDSLIGQANANVEQLMQGIDVHVLRVPSGSEQQMAQLLKRFPEVEFAELDEFVHPDRIPNDPYYSSQWHLAMINGPAAWDTTIGSSAVTVAILDTGVDGTHPDLATRMVPGWNFWDNNSNTADVYGHGTAVAGTVAATGDNGNGVASVAWNCMIMPLRISDVNGTTDYSVVANALTWAADHGARVANLSYSMTDSSTVKSAAQYFYNKGGLVTMSSGNLSTFDTNPDNPYVITVGATGSTDTIASWSNTGNNIDLAAPGDSILTTTNGGGYGAWSGTSFSSPIVAGVAALVFSVNRSLSPGQAQSILFKSADDLGATGWDTTYGWGRVNAGNAVAMAAGSGTSNPADTTPPTVAVASPGNGSTVSGNVTVSVSASDASGIASVSLSLDGGPAGTDTASPYNFSVDTTTLTNAVHTLTAQATDTAGNAATASISVTVSNVADAVAPVPTITSPGNGVKVTGNVSISSKATDNVGVTRLELYLDGAVLAGTNTSSLSTRWNTKNVKAGAHTLQARAYDKAGNVGLYQIQVYK